MRAELSKQLEPEKLSKIKNKAKNKTTQILEGLFYAI